MENQASQPTATKQTGKETSPAQFFFQAKDGGRAEDSRLTLGHNSHHHSRHRGQTTKSYNFVIASERTRESFPSHSHTASWRHSIISWTSPGCDSPVACLPPLHGLLHTPHKQIPISCFGPYQIRTNPGVSFLQFKSAAITCVVAQLSHRSRSSSSAITAWKCSFLQLPSNAWEPLLPATQKQLIPHQYIHIEPQNILKGFRARTSWIFPTKNTLVYFDTVSLSLEHYIIVQQSSKTFWIKTTVTYLNFEKSKLNDCIKKCLTSQSSKESKDGIYQQIQRERSRGKGRRWEEMTRWWCLITLTLEEKTEDFRKQSLKIAEWMLIGPAPSWHVLPKANLTAPQAESYQHVASKCAPRLTMITPAGINSSSRRPRPRYCLKEICNPQVLRSFSIGEREQNIKLRWEFSPCVEINRRKKGILAFK